MRDDVTTEWRDRGAKEGRDFAILTDTLHRDAFEISTAEHKSLKHLKKQHNLRDSMSIVELALATLAEATATELHRKRDSHGLGQLQGDARMAGGVAGNARREIEALTGEPVVTSENYQALTSPYQQGQLVIPPSDDEA